MKSRLIEKKLKEASKKMRCKPEDIWENLCDGYVDNIPSKKEIIKNINDYKR
jgi:hypothetical protein